MAEERSNRILTVPNILTLLRLVFIPVILWLMLEGDFGWALALFMAAGVSDSLDGILARLLRQKTMFGMYLDPVADKLLLSSSFLVLALTGQVSWLVTGLVLARDAAIIVTVLVIVLTTRERQFPPTVLGKVNTVVQLAAVFVVLLDIVYARGWLDTLRGVFMVLVPSLVLASGLQYAYLTVRKLLRRGRAVASL